MGSGHAFNRASLVVQMVKNLPAMQETQVQSLGREDQLEKEMATHSSILAWRIPWTEELVDSSPWDRSSVQFSSVAQLCLTLCNEPQHASSPCPSPTPRVYPNSCPLSW